MARMQANVDLADQLAASMGSSSASGSGSGSGSASASKANPPPRFDYYQTDTAVTVSVFAKGLTEDRVRVEIGEQSLNVAISNGDGSESALRIDPLYSSVNAQTSSFRVASTKVEVTLHKAAAGLRWNTLQGSSGGIATGSTPAYSQVPTPQASSSADAPNPRTSKWDKLDFDALTGGKTDEADINSFFQQIYRDANEDTRRAMMKSFQESNGTTLSTNWDEVSRGKVETKPPDGMVPKKFGN